MAINTKNPNPSIFQPAAANSPAKESGLQGRFAKYKEILDSATDKGKTAHVYFSRESLEKGSLRLTCLRAEAQCKRDFLRIFFAHSDNPSTRLSITLQIAHGGLMEVGYQEAVGCNPEAMLSLDFLRENAYSLKKIPHGGFISEWKPFAGISLRSFFYDEGASSVFMGLDEGAMRILMQHNSLQALKISDNRGSISFPISGLGFL